MTNLEALQSVIGINYPFDANMYEKAFIDASLYPGCVLLDMTMDYGPSSVKTTDLAIAELIKTILLAPDIEEGALKLTGAQKTALLSLRTSILGKYGINATGAVITSQRVW